MTGAVLLIGLLVLMLSGVPIAVSLGLAGASAIMVTSANSPWFGGFAVQQTFNAGIASYPLLALPMFVLVGSIFDRAGVARRMVDFATAVVGRGPGMLPLIVILVAMVLGGISGSGAANAAAVGSVMIAAMSRAGYPLGFSASVVGSSAATDILIPPSLGFVIYSVLIPGASLPQLFAAGIVPGVLAGVALMVPAVWLSHHYGLGQAERDLPRPPFWHSLKEASWGLATPILILGGMRAGWFTPTEAAVVAVLYGLFVGMFIHRTLRFNDLYDILAEASTISAVIMLILGAASIFSYAVNVLGLTDPIVQAFKSAGLGSMSTLALVLLTLKLVGIVLEGVSVLLIFVPLLYPLLQTYGWDPVWFGVLVMMVLALGQFTPPLAVNLMVACRIAGVPMEQTFRWIGWFFLSFFLAIAAVFWWPELALWVPRSLGY